MPGQTEVTSCAIILTIDLAASFHGVRSDALLAIAINESDLRPHIKGDNGHAFGLFQINTRHHRLPCRTVACQSFFAARLFSSFIRESKTLGGAIRRWNYNRVGYVGRVMQRLPKARKLLKACRAKENAMVTKENVAAAIIDFKGGTPDTIMISKAENFSYKTSHMLGLTLRRHVHQKDGTFELTCTKPAPVVVKAPVKAPEPVKAPKKAKKWGGFTKGDSDC